jgi:hypothetical protein
MNRLGVFLVAGALLGAPPEAHGQETDQALPLDPCAVLGSSGWVDVKGVSAEISRLGELVGAVPAAVSTVRRPSGWRGPCADTAADPSWTTRSFGSARGSLVVPRLSVEYHPLYPDDRQNGIMWAGRGVSASLAAGAVAHIGPVSAGWLPEVAWQQNRDFERRIRSRAGFSEFINPFYVSIDLPDRFGDEPYWTADAIGQSFLRVDGYGLTAGISSENIIVGPSRRNPLILSAAGPGFTHLFAGTARPLDIWIAHLDVQVIMGRTEESDYFDSVDDNDRNALALWTFSLRPRGLEGLELGLVRAYMYRPTDPGSFGDFDELRGIFGVTSESNLIGNELGGIYGRWVMDAAGAEIYGEWGRDDRWAGFWDDFVSEPDLAQFYTLGFQKLTEVGSGAVRVEGELTALQEKQENRAGRPLAVIYTHGKVRQGYTHRGQLLGAPIAPGADAQYVGVDWIRDWGYAGVFFERVRRNDASRAAVDARWNWPYEHDTELTGGVRGLVLWRGMTAAASVAFGYRWDRDFLLSMSDEKGVKAALEVSGWPRIGF